MDPAKQSLQNDIDLYVIYFPFTPVVLFTFLSHCLHIICTQAKYTVLPRNTYNYHSTCHSSINHSRTHADGKMTTQSLRFFLVSNHFNALQTTIMSVPHLLVQQINPLLIRVQIAVIVASAGANIVWQIGDESLHGFYSLSINRRCLKIGEATSSFNDSAVLILVKPQFQPFVVQPEVVDYFTESALATQHRAFFPVITQQDCLTNPLFLCYGEEIFGQRSIFWTAAQLNRLEYCGTSSR